MVLIGAALYLIRPVFLGFNGFTLDQRLPLSVRGERSNGSGIGPSSAIRALPVNAPTAACHSNPEQFLLWCSSCIVVKHSRSLLKPPSMPRVLKPKRLKIEVMTEFMT
jgi:hypothetical protein